MVLAPIREGECTASRRRRARGKATRYALWLRTRWTTLMEGDNPQVVTKSEEEIMHVPKITPKRVHALEQQSEQDKSSITTEGASLDLLEMIDQRVQQSKSAILSDVAVAMQSVVGKLGLATSCELQSLHDELRIQRERSSKEMDELIDQRVQQLKSALMGDVAVAMQSAVGTLGLAKSSELQSLHEKMRQSEKSCAGTDPEPPKYPDFEALVQRVCALENGAEKKKEGLRGRLDRLSERLDQAVRDLRGRVKEIETIVLADSEAIEAEVAPGFEDRDVDMAAFLDQFRANLVPEMPVHVDGLQARPELNGGAGFLKEWHESKGRWSVLMGAEVLLLKPANLVP